MKKIAVFILLILLLIGRKSYAFFGSNIKKNEAGKIKILFTNFEFSQDDDKKKQKNNLKFLKEIIKVIEQDLFATNLFEIENRIEINDNLELARKDGLEAVFSGAIEVNKDGSFNLKAVLYDLLEERVVFSETFVMNKDNWKRDSHIISEQIYQKLTSESVGHFDSKVLYVVKKGKKNKVAIIDFDGGNLKYLIKSKNLIFTPIFSQRNKEEIFYLEYINNSPKVQKLNVITNKKEEIAGLEDIILFPNFYLTDENILLFSAVKNDVANIYKLNLNEGKLTKLTYNKAVDKMPHFSPNGNKIVFVSNQSGSDKLYIMDADGGNIEKISHNRGSYSKPVWSPDGKLIAFIKLYKGKYHIGVMQANGESEKSLISAYWIDGVKWSSNGRYLIYSKKKGVFGKSYIYIIDILNKYEYRVPTPIGEGAIISDWIVTD